ncbi:MAG: signal peptidase I [Deltaproteobacteria bacterium]|nr:MAG: signal peptidase I [Deltaproteobacteria bacterium]
MQKSQLWCEAGGFRKTRFGHHNVLHIIILLIITITPFQVGSDASADISEYKHYKTTAISMVPTLLDGEFILVNRNCYKDQQPQRGDIIVFECPYDSNKKMIKRVIAIGTDVIKGENKNIYLNGQMIHEPYVQHTRDETVTELDNFGPVTVPEDALFVMGDNRDESFDSRFFGVVSLDKVEGKAICVQWSKKSNRNGSRIH